jgi:HTH-type transcriptional regulator/antitoxin HigA
MTPGEFLRHKLEFSGWTQKELAEVLGRPVQLVCEIANDKKRMTGETAKQLEAAGFGYAHQWMMAEAWRQLDEAAPDVRAIRRRAKLRRAMDGV